MISMFSDFNMLTFIVQELIFLKVMLKSEWQFNFYPTYIIVCEVKYSSTSSIYYVLTIDEIVIKLFIWRLGYG